ncbi:MAG: hypothetical protein ACK5NT_00910 [Pyrinomonadaceae bacterium]
MLRRAKLLLVFTLLSVSIASGAPLVGEGMAMGKGMCAMKCCKNAAKSKEKKQSNSNFLCMALNCGQTTPTNVPASQTQTVVPSFIASEKLTLKRIIFSTSPKEAATAKFKLEPLKAAYTCPIYITFQRILI